MGDSASQTPDDCTTAEIDNRIETVGVARWHTRTTDCKLGTALNCYVFMTQGWVDEELFSPTSTKRLLPLPTLFCHGNQMNMSIISFNCPEQIKK